jgi:hypothetical protein
MPTQLKIRIISFILCGLLSPLSTPQDYEIPYQILVAGKGDYFSTSRKLSIAQPQGTSSYRHLSGNI